MLRDELPCSPLVSPQDTVCQCPSQQWRHLICRRTEESENVIPLQVCHRFMICTAGGPEHTHDISANFCYQMSSTNSLNSVHCADSARWRTAAKRGMSPSNFLIRSFSHPAHLFFDALCSRGTERNEYSLLWRKPICFTVISSDVMKQCK